MPKGPHAAETHLSIRHVNYACGKVGGALPRTPARGAPPETPAPFPFISIFQNGPPRPGCAEINLFNPRKDFPPPRPKRAPWTAPGRSKNVRVRRERGQMQRSSPSQLAAEPGLPPVGPEPQEMLVAERTLIGGNHPRQVYRFQDHLVLETILHFRIILGLENARQFPAVAIRPGEPIALLESCTRSLTGSTNKSKRNIC